MEIKLREGFNREKRLERMKDFVSFKGNLTYGYTNERLEEKRKEEIKRLRELADCIEKMTIEEYDAYFHATSIFESNVTDAMYTGIMESSSEIIGVYYGENKTIYHLTSISHYENNEEENY